MFDGSNHGIPEVLAELVNRRAWDPFLPEEFRFTTFLNLALTGQIDFDHDDAFEAFRSHVKSSATKARLNLNNIWPKNERGLLSELSQRRTRNHCLGPVCQH